MKSGHVNVCVCTYRRPGMLLRLLEALERQRLDAGFTFGVVIADNDAARSAEEVVAGFARRSSLEVVYCSEPRQNIALARNRAITNSEGEFIAFIDDDEFPADDWLARMLAALAEYKAAGILGPVRPHFDSPPPAWVLKGRFCERPEPPTGTVLISSQCRTGNVLFRVSILNAGEQPFDEQYGTGGEDVDFFRRMTARGCIFVWCNEGVAYETVPPSRQTRSYMLKRALLRGRIVLKHPRGRTKLVGQSLVAVPAYTLILPITLLFGQHVFMKYCIKFCDHAGRVLALFGLNPVTERPTS